MPELRDARVRIGVPGLNGGDVTNAEFVALESRVEGIEETTIPTVINDLTNVSGTPATGDLLQYDGSGWVPAEVDLTHTVPFGVTLVANGGGSEPSLGTVGIVKFWFDCTLVDWQVNSNPSGTIEWDMRVGGVSIVGTEKLKTTSAFVKTMTSLAGWTTEITAGTSVEFVVLSASTTTISSINVKFEREI